MYNYMHTKHYNYVYIATSNYYICTVVVRIKPKIVRSSNEQIVLIVHARVKVLFLM